MKNWCTFQFMYFWFLFVLMSFCIFVCLYVQIKRHSLPINIKRSVAPLFRPDLGATPLSFQDLAFSSGKEIEQVQQKTGKSNEFVIFFQTWITFSTRDVQRDTVHAPKWEYFVFKGRFRLWRSPWRIDQSQPKTRCAKVFVFGAAVVSWCAAWFWLNSNPVTAVFPFLPKRRYFAFKRKVSYSSKVETSWMKIEKGSITS